MSDASFLSRLSDFAEQVLISSAYVQQKARPFREKIDLSGLAFVKSWHKI